MNKPLLIAVLLTLLAGRAGAADAPHVVVFLADDLGWGDCSPYGGKDVPTPNMVRLAADGVTLTHAFVASPSCTPSRAARLTGLDPMRNGAMLNHARPAEELFDLNADPWELKNLAADPKHAGRLKTLRTDLDAWMKAQGDEGRKTERALPNPQPMKKK
ncbi:Arylsulfatase precursor [Gemmata obscuriglobus]|nr:sulfatase-like hydrolase/transferase [Gemmata obscuriglobus]QEG31316.1 Arylsulfatase precursor [Gemmata obscuriglobus]VTS10655.1 heparan n-sulfatase : Sulfatase and glycosyl hydrolase family 43 domain protein OS=Rhodopirellula maiorica SM1 GN=RMSM_07643 PE=4 SV=1: Sulfatase [Gemmata obscuriglobus UQM 2246]